MEPFESELEAFFRSTRAPQEDEEFVWRALEEYERRTRFWALGSTAVRTAGFAFALLVMSSLGPSVDEAQQALLADGFRLAVLAGVFGAALVYAARNLGGGLPAWDARAAR